MGSAELWRWIWLVAAVLFAVSGAGSRRSALLAPLAVASGLAFMALMFQQSPTTALIVFLVVAVVGVLAIVFLGSRTPPGGTSVAGERQFDTDD